MCLFYIFKFLIFYSHRVDIYYDLDENEESSVNLSYSDLLKREDIQAVDIIIPIENTPEFVEMALEAGKHVISEKPMAPTVKIGEELLEKYETCLKKYPNLVWAIAEQIYYEPTWNLLLQHREQRENLKRKLLRESGEAGSLSDSSSGSQKLTNSSSKSKKNLLIGEPLVATLTRCVSMNQNNKYYSTKWRKQPSHQGGYILDAGIHEIAKLRMAFGQIKKVTAMTAQFKPDLPPLDTISSTIQFVSGVLCTFSLTFTASSQSIADACVNHEFMISGSDGALFANPNELVFMTESETQVGQVQHQITHVENEKGKLSIKRELLSFALTVLQKNSSSAKGIYSPREGLQDLVVIEALLESAKLGQTVQVKQVHGLKKRRGSSLSRKPKPSDPF